MSRVLYAWSIGLPATFDTSLRELRIYLTTTAAHTHLQTPPLHIPRIPQRLPFHSSLSSSPPAYFVYGPASKKKLASCLQQDAD